MQKITNFNKINKYWCKKHNRYHVKKRNGKICKPFKDCKEFAYKLTDTENRNTSFRRLWKRQGNEPKKYTKPAYFIN